MALKAWKCFKLLMVVTVLLGLATPAFTAPFETSTDDTNAVHGSSALKPGRDLQDPHSGDVTSMSGDADAMAAGEVTPLNPGSGSDPEVPSSGRSELNSDPKFSDIMAQDTASSGQPSDVSGQEAASSMTSPSTSPGEVQTTERETTRTTTTTTAIGGRCVDSSLCPGICKDGICECLETHFLINGTCEKRPGIGEDCRSDNCASPLKCQKSKNATVCRCPNDLYWSRTHSDCRNDSLIKANISLTEEGANNLTVSWSVKEPQDVANFRIVLWKVLEETNNTKVTCTSGVTSPYELSNLEQGHKYKVRVVSETNHSQEAVRSDVFHVTEPSAVSFLSVQAMSESCIELRWEAGKGVRETFLVETSSLEGDATPVPPQKVNVTSQEVCGLEPGSRYNFSVVSESHDKRSAPVYGVAMTEPKAPSAVKVTGNSTCAHLTWTEPQGRHDVIKIELVQSGSTGTPRNHTVLANGNAKAASVCGLLPGESYDVSVTSERSGMASKKERTVVDTCAARVVNVTWTEEEPGRVMVTWQPLGRVQYYVAELLSGGDVISAVLNDSTWRPNQTLQYGVSYQGSILPRANNCSDGKTVFNITISVPRPAAVKPNITWSAEEGLQVVWFPPDPPYDVILAYRIELMQGGQLFLTDEIPSNQTTWSAVVPRGRCYFVAVAAENREGESDPSPVPIRVPADAPGPVTNLSVEHAEVGVVTVQWEPPTEPNGAIIGYELNVTDGDTGIHKVFHFNCTGNCSVTCSKNRTLAPQSFNDVDSMETPLGGQTFAFNVTELCPPASLEVRIVARTSFGFGNVSSVWISLEEETPGPVTNLSVEHAEVGVVTVQWEPPTERNGAIIGYELNVTDGDTGIHKVFRFNCTDNCSVTCSKNRTLAPQSFNDVDSRETTLGGQTFAFNVTEFCPPASLEVRIVARTSSGIGNMSSVWISLEEEKPGSPTNFSARILNATAIFLQWTEPLGHGRCNSTVTSYELTYSIATSTREPFYTTLQTWVTSAPMQVSDQQSAQVAPWRTHHSTSFVPMTSPPPKSTMQYTPSFLPSYPYSSYSTPPYSNVDVTVSPIGQSERNLTLSGTDREFLLVGLDYWTPYSLVLVAVGRSGKGILRRVFARTDEYVPTSPVREVSVTSKSTTSLNVMWLEPSQPNGIISHYRVEIRTRERACYNVTAPPTPAVPWRNDTTSGNDVTLRDLAPYWSYDVIVVPCTTVGCGTLESTVQAMTLPQVPSSMENTTFTLEHLEPESARISWPPVCHVNDDPSSLQYFLEFRPTIDSLQGGTLHTHNSTVLLQGLSPLTNYSIRVTAFNTKGNGKHSDWSVVFMTPNKAPDNITSTIPQTLNATCMSVTWTGGGVVRGSPVNHTLVVLDVDSGDKTEVSCPLTQGAAHGCLVCGLTPYWNYSVWVRVENDAGIAESQTPARVSMPGAVPGPVQDLSVSAPRESDVTAPRLINVTWSPPLPRQRHGVITGYVINITSPHSILQSHEVEDGSLRPSYSKVLSVQGEAEYDVEVAARTKNGTGVSTQKLHLLVPAGALPDPPEGEKELLITEQVNTTKDDPSRQIALSLPTAFLCNNSFGRPKGWGVVVQANPPTQLGRPYRGKKEGYGDSYPVWFESPQPSRYLVELREFSCLKSERFTVVMGRDEDCKDLPRRQCNGPLQPSTTYRFRAFMCTQAGCTETPFSDLMRTADPKSIQPAIIAVIVLVASLLVILIVVVVVVVRRRRNSSSRFPTEKIGMRMMDSARGQRVTASTGSEFTRSRPVKLVNFAQHVELMHQQSNLGFCDEFKKLKAMSPMHSTKTAELLACKGKNRYHNILPFDRTRVKLLPNDDEEGSDYINANFIMGYSHKREYIAAQGPLPGTADDFWRMVWEQKVKVIVMLTQCVERGKVKCEEYWPECSDPEYYGDLLVQVRSQSVLPNYVIRIVDLVMGETKRTIKHFHFLKWPDFGCPEKTWLLLNFVSAVRSHTPHDSGPIVVHCSAGVGRTGTFISVDYSLQHIREHDELDILGLVLQMRDSRTQMVQNESQYIYIHDCIRDALEEETDEEEEEEDMLEEANEHIYMNSGECDGNLARA